MQATPAGWRLLLESGWPGLPAEASAQAGCKQLKILCGGEALPRELADELLERGASVWNLYGPTETTIWSTLYQVQPVKKLIAPELIADGQKLAPSKPSAIYQPSTLLPSTNLVPIGRPIANTQIYILDRQ